MDNLEMSRKIFRSFKKWKLWFLIALIVLTVAGIIIIKNYFSTALVTVSTIESSAPFIPLSAVVNQGYENKDFVWIVDNGTAKLVEIKIEEYIDDGSYVDTFSISWEGKLKVPFEDKYTFYTISDDGVRLWIDGKLIINNWTDHPPTEDQARVSLSAGNYDIELEFYESWGGAAIKLFWSSTKFPKSIILPDYFYHEANGHKRQGLIGQYYDELNFKDLKITRVDPNIDFDWEEGSPLVQEPVYVIINGRVRVVEGLKRGDKVILYSSKALRIGMPSKEREAQPKLFGKDRYDFVGKGDYVGASGEKDIHIQIILKKDIPVSKYKIITEDNQVWAYPYNGSDWIIYPIRKVNVVDLFFEPKTPFVYNLYAVMVVYKDGSTQFEIVK